MHQLTKPFTENHEVEDKIIDCFFRKIKLRVLYDKGSFLLTELLLDLKEMSYEFGLDSPPSRLTHTYQLKKMLFSRLGDKINIVSFGDHDAAISKDPLSYSYATIKGHGLCENYIITIPNLIRKKIADKKNPMKWPLK